MPSVDHDKFLQKLEQEAQLQASVYRTQILPKQLGGLARLVAQYPWQCLLLLAGATATVLELWQ
jgi:hypothetical protein